MVLVDSAVIAQAPGRFLSSGMGDALSTWFEAESCRIARANNMTGRPGPMTAYALARLCFDTLMDYGPLALQAVEAHVVTPALEKVIEANTLLSGLGFESGGLGACHAIHNGLTVLPETHSAWHGEKVTIGVLAALFLTDQPAEMVERVYGFCESVKLPTTLADIGLSDVLRRRPDDGSPRRPAPRVRRSTTNPTRSAPGRYSGPSGWRTPKAGAARLGALDDQAAARRRGEPPVPDLQPETTMRWYDGGALRCECPVSCFGLALLAVARTAFPCRCAEQVHGCPVKENKLYHG